MSRAEQRSAATRSTALRCRKFVVSGALCCAGGAPCKRRGQKDGPNYGNYGFTVIYGRKIDRNVITVIIRNYVDYGNYCITVTITDYDGRNRKP